MSFACWKASVGHAWRQRPHSRQLSLILTVLTLISTALTGHTSTQRRHTPLPPEAISRQYVELVRGLALYSAGLNTRALEGSISESAMSPSGFDTFCQSCWMSIRSSSMSRFSAMVPLSQRHASHVINHCSSAAQAATQPAKPHRSLCPAKSPSLLVPSRSACTRVPPGLANISKHSAEKGPGKHLLLRPLCEDVCVVC